MVVFVVASLKLLESAPGIAASGTKMTDFQMLLCPCNRHERLREKLREALGDVGHPFHALRCR